MSLHPKTFRAFFANAYARRRLRINREQNKIVDTVSDIAATLKISNMVSTARGKAGQLIAGFGKKR